MYHFIIRLRNTLSCSLALAALLAPIAGAVIAANGDDPPPKPYCDFPVGGENYCESTHFAMIYPNESGPSYYCKDETLRYCVGVVPSGGYSAVPPSPAFIECREAKAKATWRCHVWPRGDLRFDWSVSAHLEMAGGPNGFSELVRCLPAPTADALVDPLRYVSVEITTPQGLSNTVHAMIHCPQLSSAD